MGKFSENIEKRFEFKKQINELWWENLKSIRRYYGHLREVGIIKEERLAIYWSAVLPPYVPDDGHVYINVQYEIQGDGYFGHSKNEIIKADDIDNFLNYEHTKQRFEQAEILFHREKSNPSIDLRE